MSLPTSRVPTSDDRIWRRSYAYAIDVPDFLTFLLLALAVTRVTQLVVSDKIGHPFRSWVLKRNGDHGMWTFAVHCPWCVGMWMALGASPLWWYFGRNPIFVMVCVALALSQVVGLISKLNSEG